MSKKTRSPARNDWDAELSLLGHMRQSRSDFIDQVCRSSDSQQERVLSILRLDACYQMAEFYFLLQANNIQSEQDIRSLAELHNQYIIDLVKNQEKLRRIGLTNERALEGMFTSDTMPRLLQNWRERTGTIDQSNLARLLMSVMSTETCRKVVVACAEAGFFERRRSTQGTILVHSTGRLEEIFGMSLRVLRQAIDRET